MTISAGDIMFVWGKTFVDEAIEHITDGPSHCALFLNSTTIAEAQGGRLVGESPLNAYLTGSARVEVWGDDSLTNSDREIMVSFAKAHYGIPYDYVLIPLEWAHYELHIKLDWYKEHQHLICSTFVNDCAEAAHKHWTDVSNPAPKDLIAGGVLRQKAVLHMA